MNKLAYNNIIAGIVLYNPDISRLRENINSILSQVTSIILIDNCSKNYEEIQSLVKDDKKIFLVHNTENLGVANAYNQIWKYAIKKNIDWFLTLDQDSISPPNLIKEYFEIINDCNLRIGILSPFIVDRNDKIRHTSLHNNCDEINWCISSASLINTEACCEVSGFDESLFIDCVDIDFCFRLKNIGYKVLRCNKTILYHELGDNFSRRKLFGIPLIISEHSPFRYFYIARNNIYLSKKLSNKSFIMENLKVIIKIILYEKQKILKLRMIHKGIKAAYLNKMGKMESEAI